MAELQPFIVAAFPQPFNATVLNHTVYVDTFALFTPLITLVMSEEYMFVVGDVPRRRDGALFPPDLQNLTLPGGVALYTQLVQGGGGGGCLRCLMPRFAGVPWIPFADP